MPLIKVCQFSSNKYEIKSVIPLHAEATLSKISEILNNASAWKDLLVVGTAQQTVRPSNQIARWSHADHVIDWLVLTTPGSPTKFSRSRD